MQIIVIIFFVIILFIFLFLSLSSDKDDEDQKRIAGKEGELQAKKVLNHYLNENGSCKRRINRIRYEKGN